ncbi:MAG: hypothetical protein HQM03_05115 [Magnetococcales bacterium]|nr:hypothetical protein [Magnetococcales bacterium]
MSTAEEIYDKARNMPETLAREVLDFMLFVEQRQSTLQGVSDDERTAPETMMRLVKAAQESFPKVDFATLRQEFASLRDEWDRTL